MKQHRVTKAEYRVFCDEVRRLIDLFGLMDWSVRFEHCQTDNAEAQCDFCVENNAAVISATVFVDENADQNFDPICHARHEFCHLWLARLEWLATCRYLSGEEITECVERMCTQFEKRTIA